MESWLLGGGCQVRENWETILDKTNSGVTYYTVVDALEPVEARFVRLTMTDWPHVGGISLHLAEFTVISWPVPTDR